jgi:hypothetical protein
VAIHRLSDKREAYMSFEERLLASYNASAARGREEKSRLYQQNLDALLKRVEQAKSAGRTTLCVSLDEFEPLNKPALFEKLGNDDLTAHGIFLREKNGHKPGCDCERHNRYEPIYKHTFCKKEVELAWTQGRTPSQ